MVAFTPKETVLHYLGIAASRIRSFIISASASFFVAACSRTVIPVSAGVYLAGAGISAAFIILWVAPATNILALMYTGAILGWDITLVRIVSALLKAMVVGTVTTFAFYREELRRLSEVHALMSQGTATLITVIREQTQEPSCCSVGQIPEEVDAMEQVMEECGVEV